MNDSAKQLGSTFAGIFKDLVTAINRLSDRVTEIENALVASGHMRRVQTRPSKPEPLPIGAPGQWSDYTASRRGS